jgi:hypothetical protein
MRAARGRELLDTVTGYVATLRRSMRQVYRGGEPRESPLTPLDARGPYHYQNFLYVTFACRESML